MKPGLLALLPYAIALTAAFPEEIVGAQTAQVPSTRPNIIFILADDLGYGDVSCYNAKSKIQTPNLDTLAAQGMRFTDAHSPSGVCTPTRYGLLMGRYAWRSTLKSGVLGGYSTPLLAPDRKTVANLLQEVGYRTACIGKWHLGMDLPTTDGQSLRSGNKGVPDNPDWKGVIRNGPRARGFDYFFGCTASWDMPPYAWIENDRFVRTDLVPTEKNDWFGRPGVKSPGMKPEDALPAITRKAVDFIRTSAREHADTPFFLYFPLTAPHAPVAPNAPFKGKSRAGDYGDFVVEVDDTVGRVMAALEQAGLTTNTLLVFTSDNGPENPMEKRKTEYRHFSAADFLGHKRDNWEGGHRVPFIVRWPGRVSPGTSSDEIICLTDLMATAAEVVGRALPPAMGEDSYSLLPVLHGAKLTRPLREATVHHSSGGEFSIRQGQWKLLLHPGSGGNNYRGRPEYTVYYEKPVQLYNLESDPSETTNLADSKPEVVTSLAALMTRYVLEGRSTPGPAQTNDTPNDWKQLSWMKQPRAARSGSTQAKSRPASAPSRSGTGFRFRHHFLDRTLPGDSWAQTALADVDQDGRLDYITGQTRSSIFWYRQEALDRWERHRLGDQSPSDVGGAALDVDEDGWVDFVTGGVWYRNTGKPRSEPFERIVFDAGLAAVHDVIIADVDGDGRSDVLTMSDKNNLRWYRIALNPREAWQRTDIGSSVHAGIGVGDVDGDGDLDVVRSNMWFENADGKGARWFEHQNIPFGNPSQPYPLATHCVVLDLDRDRDNDLVMTENEIKGGRIGWLENLDGKGGAWTLHALPAGDTPARGAYHSLIVADFDTDGDPDIFSCEMEGIPGDKPPRWFLWENADGRAGKFIEHIVLNANLGGHLAVAADVDGDGDLDIVSKLWRARKDNANDGRNHVDLLENLEIRNP